MAPPRRSQARRASAQRQLSAISCAGASDGSARAASASTTECSRRLAGTPIERRTRGGLHAWRRPAAAARAPAEIGAAEPFGTRRQSQKRTALFAACRLVQSASSAAHDPTASTAAFARRLFGAVRGAALGVCSVSPGKVRLVRLLRGTCIAALQWARTSAHGPGRCGPFQSTRAAAPRGGRVESTTVRVVARGSTSERRRIHQGGAQCRVRRALARAIG